jgi:DNA-binding FrmR family transcriptional regulator
MGYVISLNMKKRMSHKNKLTALKRIEGQVRGVQKMIEDERYCVDIINALAAVMGALKRVEANVLKDHLHSCAKNAFEGKSKKEKEEKLEELCNLLTSFKR